MIVLGNFFYVLVLFVFGYFINIIVLYFLLFFLKFLKFCGGSGFENISVLLF